MFPKLKPALKWLQQHRPDWLRHDPGCLLCLGPCHHPSGICAPCQNDLPGLGPHCTRCCLPMPLENTLCGQCLKNPPAFQHCTAAWQYAFPIDALINRFKHHRQWPGGYSLSLLLAQCLEQQYQAGLARPDLLIPVPLSARRQRHRSFNQAHMIARWLGHRLQLPVQAGAVLRSRDTPTQQGQSAQQRRRNLKNAFIVRRLDRLQGLHIALVDDVMTTGATARELSGLLLAAGATRVDLYLLARTPSHTHTIY